MNLIVGRLVKFSIVEKLVAPADYYRTWWNLEKYFETSIFLPHLQNEDPATYSQEQKDRILSLTNFGMFMWTEDRTIIPRESSWFASWDSYRRLVMLRDSIDYKDDYIGLRTLDEAGKLFFYSGPGDHMHLTDSMINDQLVPLLLGQTPAPSVY